MQLFFFFPRALLFFISRFDSPESVIENKNKAIFESNNTNINFLFLASISPSVRPLLAATDSIHYPAILLGDKWAGPRRERDIANLVARYFRCAVTIVFFWSPCRWEPLILAVSQTRGKAARTYTHMENGIRASTRFVSLPKIGTDLFVVYYRLVSSCCSFSSSFVPSPLREMRCCSQKAEQNTSRSRVEIGPLFQITPVRASEHCSTKKREDGLSLDKSRTRHPIQVLSGRDFRSPGCELAG